jgi:limonene-1,2-epoxide hydrolase
MIAVIPARLSHALTETGVREGGVVKSNTEIVREFIAAWTRLDPAELAAYFTEDGVYHNMPMQPVAGRANVENLIRGFTAGWSETRWEIRHLFAQGDVVFAERIDRTRVGEKRVELPCAGVFELRGGKIAVWRDYFDLGAYTRALA